MKAAVITRALVVLAAALVLIARATALHAAAAAESAPSLIFDGRAARMVYLRCDRKRCAQRPEIWSGLQFCGDDITLEHNVRFRRVYRYRTDSGSDLAGCSGGPIWSPSVAYASLNHLAARQVLGTIQYYRESIMLPRGFAFIRPGWESLAQYGFGPYNGAVQLQLRDDFGGPHFELQLNGGEVANCQGPDWWAQGNVFDLGDAVSLEGHWVDFIVGIKFATDTTGWVDVYRRIPDRGQRTFRPIRHLAGKPTYQWGTCGKYTISDTGTDSVGHTVRYMDQQNDYEGYWDDRPRSQFPTHSFLRSGLLIAPSLAAAEAAAP
jgi:hypothetical protein